MLRQTTTLEAKVREDVIKASVDHCMMLYDLSHVFAVFLLTRAQTRPFTT
jgi:hypothetical protein